MCRLQFLLCALLWIAPMGPVTAQSELVLSEWEQWLARMGDPAATLVLVVDGREVLAEARGVDIDAALPLASNSKAITALCAQALVEDGQLRWDTPLSTWFETRHGSVTVGQLVDHTSGLWPDRTQRGMLQWKDDPAPRWAEAREAALGRIWQRGRVGVFRYNNENYAVLGDVIERVTGQGYAEACAQRVLAPMGIGSALLEPAFGSFGPWGGWSMSVRDYARLIRQGFAGRNPTAAPHAPVSEDGAVVYGLGMLARMSRFAPNHWHFGALCFDGEGIGAFAMDLAGRYTVVAAYATCTTEDDRLALQDSLARAILAD
jgi:CubicO group peptidase (beta-lactamase class C family)